MRNRTYSETMHLVNRINRYRERQENEIINQCEDLMEDYFTPVEPHKDKGL